MIRSTVQQLQEGICKRYHQKSLILAFFYTHTHIHTRGLQKLSCFHAPHYFVSSVTCAKKFWGTVALNSSTINTSLQCDLQPFAYLLYPQGNIRAAGYLDSAGRAWAEIPDLQHQAEKRQELLVQTWLQGNADIWRNHLNKAWWNCFFTLVQLYSSRGEGPPATPRTRFTRFFFFTRFSILSTITLNVMHAVAAL